MKIDVTEICHGKWNNKEIWICDFRQVSAGTKPIRNIKPQKAQVLSNDLIESKKTIYYSKSHLRPIGASGKVLSKIISPVDNTGYRSKSGVHINAFTTEDECRECFREQVQEVYAMHVREIDKLNEKRVELFRLYNEYK